MISTRRQAIPLPPSPGLDDIIRLLTTLPDSAGLQLPCFSWWDVVITRNGSIGEDLLWWIRRNQIGGCGAVVTDEERNLMLWLVPPTGSCDWLHRGGVWVSRPVNVVLPSLRRISPPGAYWATSLAFGHLVDPRFLRAGLDHLGMSDTPNTASLLPG
ncbi:hypothetical protein [Streptomyces sp. MI02-7b]|uniref:hypothetical protein n=1 Tax=Streptomyces sp. MI02-7b TaxID=462941 RepID=UPI0029BF781D|nr:hypothetical protein [Streptomyces sp. MI02-7b]MDX3078623.1 hypothetical protein [Streptomyces sp. MI02-7b]